MLIIDAFPQVEIMGVELQEKINELRNNNLAASVLGPDELKNKWRKLVVRDSLAGIINGKFNEEEQLNAIYAHLKQWCKTLFEDGKIEVLLDNTFKS